MTAREFFDLVAEWVDAERAFRLNGLTCDQLKAVDRRNKIAREVDRVRYILKQSENSDGGHD